MPGRFTLSSLLILVGALAGSLLAGFVAGRTPPALATQTSATPAAPLITELPNLNATNAKVEPGKVRWHPTFDAARAAAEKSRKPGLHFQMMGRLDQTFC